MATEAFLNDTECRNCTWPELEKLWSSSKSPNGGLDGLDRLETTQCLKEYSVYVQSRRRNLLLVTREDDFVGERNYSKPPDYINYESDKRVENSNIYQTFRFNAEMATRPGFTWEHPYAWILSGDHSDRTPEEALQELERAPQTWKVGSYDYSPAEPVLLEWPVLYCLSERATPHCKLRFSRVIAIVVTCLNFGEQHKQAQTINLCSAILIHMSSESSAHVLRRILRQRRPHPDHWRRNRILPRVPRSHYRGTLYFQFFLQTQGLQSKHQEVV